MAVHHPLVPVEVVAPELGEEHLPGEHPARRGQEGVEQLELPGGQVQRPAVQQDLPAVQVQGQVPVAQAAVLPGVSPAAEDDPDLLQQHRHGEGLRDIVVDVQPEAPELRFLPVQGGEHQNGHLGLAADARADPKAVDLGEHQVQQHQVEGLRAEPLQGRHPVPGHGGLVARVLQVGP